MSIRTGWYVTCQPLLETPMRSTSLTVARRAQGLQPAHDVSDPHVPHLRILSILGQHFVAFDHRDQKARSLFWNQVAAHCSLRLPPPQGRGNACLPRTENSLQSLAELFVELRHLLGQVNQRTTALYVSWAMGYRPYNGDQSIDGVLVLAALQRKHPPISGEFGDDLFDDRISQSFLAFEMIVERSLSDIGSGQNCINPGTLKTVSVNLPKGRLQQVFPRALRITGLSRPAATDRHTN